MIELAPPEMWKYNVTKTEAKMYIFMTKGYRIGTLEEMHSLQNNILDIDHTMWDAWTLDAVDSNNVPDDEVGTVIPIRTRQC
jgi:hypothetical protein